MDHFSTRKKQRKRTKLKDLVIRQVALVDRGANQEAKVALRKNAELPCETCGGPVSVDGPDPENRDVLFSSCANCRQAYTICDDVRKAIDGTMFADFNAEVAIAKFDRVRASVREEIQKVRPAYETRETPSSLSTIRKALMDGAENISVTGDAIDPALRDEALKIWYARGAPAPADRNLARIMDELYRQAVDPTRPMSAENPTWSQMLSRAQPTQKALRERQGIESDRDAADAGIAALVAKVQRENPDWKALRCHDAALSSPQGQALYQKRLGAQRRLQAIERGE